MTPDELLKMEESQIFDRKSIGIKSTDLSQHLCAFANADGGSIAVGISDKTRKIEGVDYEQDKLNDILRVPIDYCRPTVPVSIEMVPCIDSKGRDNHILLFHIDASPELHANQQDEAFIRVGDKSRKLSFEDRVSLMYDKGLRRFEDTPVNGATFADLDIIFLNEHLVKIGYGKSPEEYLLQNKHFAVKAGETLRPSTACVLLFGKNPQQFFPRARIRYIRYEGTEAKTGAQMNVIKDVLFEGRILKQVEDCVEYLKTQIKEHTYLGRDGIFVTEREYPEFVLTELIVNAVIHRDYSISGTDIQVKMFDDRIEVDSPGKLPGTVKPENIRYTHFSRNPVIAEFLKQYEYVKEYGEGIDRIYRVLEEAGFKPIHINNDVFILKVTVYNLEIAKPEAVGQKPEAVEQKPEAAEQKPEAVEADQIMEVLKVHNAPSPTISNAKKILAEKGAESFTSGDIVKILNCSQSAASDMIKKFEHKYGIITSAQDDGRYRYRFVTKPQAADTGDGT